MRQSYGKWWFWLAIGAVPAYAQPTISSIQASVVGGAPANVQSITSGTNLPAQSFTMYINGSFNPNLADGTTVTWTNTSTGTTAGLQPTSFTPNQIQVNVPAGLYSATVTTTQPVTITVTQGQASAFGSFAVVSPLSSPASLLPLATVGTAYSTALVLGGTPPFQTSSGGFLPPGLTPGTGVPNRFLTGTPTTQGVYQFLVTTADFWGNSLTSPTFTVEEVAAALVTSLVPSSVAAGSPTTQVTVNGKNFVDPTTPYGGSVARWTFGGGTTPLLTTFVSPTQLTVSVPNANLTIPGTAAISVLQPDQSVSNGISFGIVAPAITSLNPSSVVVGNGFTLTVNGSNFAARPSSDVGGGVSPLVRFGSTVLTATFVNSTSVTVPIPAGLVPLPGTIPVTVVNPGGSTSNTVNLTVTPSLAIATTALPNGTSGAPYFAQLVATGGLGPYTWSVTGLPVGLVFNAAGLISGTPGISGTFALTVTVTDSQKTTVQAPLSLTINTPPPSISTGSTLPGGQVGVPYQATIGVSGGGGPFTFSVSSGNLPDGLSMTGNGLIFGTPSRAGTFGFTVAASDPLGNNVSKGFSITIIPAPLTFPPGGTTTTTPAGTPVNISVTPTGGVGPYTYTVNCILPPGVTFSNGVLSGTPTTPGTYTCPITAVDSTGTSVTKTVTITVTPPPITFAGGALPDGQVGVPYSASVRAAGGTSPFTYSGSGLPDGLSMSGNGSISGTPSAEGQYSLSVTATDATGARASASFSITIIPARLIVTTTSLPDGVVGTAYSASLAAAGGVRPYTWSVGGLPGGVAATSAGAIGGSPNAPGTFTVSATVRDNAGATASASFTVTVAPAALVITTPSAPNGTVGAAYSASFAATGGVPPFVWSATGLSAGLSISSTGTISGTPVGPGTSNATIGVRDSTGASTTKAYTIVIVLPATPPLSFAGIGATTNPLQQPRLTVALGQTYPVDVVVTLTMTFAPDAGADDPSVVFAAGGRTARITVPAGSTAGTTDAGVQTGTVAGLITITAQLQATGLDVTPSPAPRQTIRISPAPPVMTSVTAARTANGFTVTIVGYVTDREITQAIFTFNPAPGANLQTTSLTVTVDTLFGGYFGGAASAAFGSQFTFTQPFTINGSSSAIASVTVTLVNRLGSSTSVTVNLN